MVVFIDLAQDLGPHSATGQLNACVSRAAISLFVSQNGEIGCGLLLVRVNEENVLTGRGTENGKVGSNGRFA
jgi:hypothetical protein